MSSKDKSKKSDDVDHNKIYDSLYETQAKKDYEYEEFNRTDITLKRRGENKLNQKAMLGLEVSLSDTETVHYAISNEGVYKEILEALNGKSEKISLPVSGNSRRYRETEGTRWIT